MTTSYPLPLKLYSIEDNFISLHNFLKGVYREKKDSHEQRISFFKGVFETNDKVDRHANADLPVNNFLKDFKQIEEEFKNEHLSAGGYCIHLEGRLLSDQEVLSRPMEENY